MSTQTLYAQISKKYSGLSREQFATQLMKDSIDVGKAVVNILGSTGIAGFKFNIPEREQIKLQSKATDHYIDTNVPVQDHIAQEPIIITLGGFQGDYFYSVNQIEDMLAKVVPTMALVKAFLPQLPDSAKQQLAKKYQQITQSTNIPKALQTDSQTKNFSQMDLFKLFQEVYKLKSPQSRAFFFFKSLWKSKAMFSVETTWERFDNMIITDVTPIRDNNADITDFTVSFKQILITSSLVRNLNNAAGRTRQQLAEVAQKGLDKGQEASAI